MKNQELKEIYNLLKQARVKLEKIANRSVKVDTTNACETCDGMISSAMGELKSIDQYLG